MTLNVCRLSASKALGMRPPDLAIRAEESDRLEWRNDAVVLRVTAHAEIQYDLSERYEM
jgi:hypothetical protein